MYLTQILEIDPAWLGQDWDNGDEVDDARCLAYFHHWRTIKLLQDVRNEIGSSTFEQLWLHFESIRNAGYELEEVVHTDTSVLIDRDAWQGLDEEDEESASDIENDEDEGDVSGGDNT